MYVAVSSNHETQDSHSSAQQADVFWQNAGFGLEHERFKCNNDDGTYTLDFHDSPDEQLADNADMPDVSIFTGLATVRLVELGGTRLFFHDSVAVLRQLEYSVSNTWEYIGIVNPDGHLQGPQVGAAVVNGTAEMWTILGKHLEQPLESPPPPLCAAEPILLPL